MQENAVEETSKLAAYVKGMADCTDNPTLDKAAEWLEKLSRHVCGRGYIGCDGGVDCDYDHK